MSFVIGIVSILNYKLYLRLIYHSQIRKSFHRPKENNGKSRKTTENVEKIAARILAILEVKPKLFEYIASGLLQNLVTWRKLFGSTRFLNVKVPHS